MEYLNRVESEEFERNLENFDLETFEKFFLVNEYYGDIDFLWNSCFFHKKK